MPGGRTNTCIVHKIIEHRLITGSPFTKQNFLAKSKTTVNLYMDDGSLNKTTVIKDTALLRAC